MLGSPQLDRGGSGRLFLARPELLQLLTSRSNLQTMGLYRKPKPMADLVLKLFDLIALELDDLLAILANDVVVMRMLSVVGIVKFVVLAEIHFPNQSAFR